jgi:phospholipase C
MGSSIEHVIVLMLENRSFDHMLGFMRSPSYQINGLTGDETNPRDPAHLDPTQNVKASNDAGFIFSYDPGHDFHDVNLQLFDNPAGPPARSLPNGGFILSYSQQPHVTPAIADTIMKCMAPTTIPVLTTLAREFAVCDAWYSSVPGPTWPNRFFVHAATSKGYLDNSQLRNYDMPTIFENLAAAGRTWRDYYHDVSQTWALQRLQTNANKANFYSFRQFRTDAREGKLPNYAFIEPKYFSFLGEANDQHPPHDIRAGEALDRRHVTTACELLLNGKKACSMILHDEHGGMYDHDTAARHTSRLLYFTVCLRPIWSARSGRARFAIHSEGNYRPPRFRPYVDSSHPETDFQFALVSHKSRCLGPDVLRPAVFEHRAYRCTVQCRRKSHCSACALARDASDT